MLGMERSTVMLLEIGISVAIYSSLSSMQSAIENHQHVSVDVGGEGGARSNDLIFGSSTKSAQKLSNQMNSRGWTEDIIRDTVDNPFTIRNSINKATGNSATVFYNKQGSYVIVDDITNEIVQISDNINPLIWIPDASIENPYKP